MIQFIRSSKKDNLIHSDKNQIRECLVEDRGIGRERTKETLWGDGNVLYLAEEMVTWVYTYLRQNFSGCLIKTHAFYVTKFYINKVYFKVSSLYISTLILSKYYETQLL